MSIPDYFSATYVDARQGFLQACADKGHAVTAYVNDKAKGVSGEDLVTDVVRIGPQTADNLLIVISGTHGAEGPCGSGIQRGLIEEGFFDALPASTAVLLVHAINPYGFSHCRRVNEDNIDLNRNFSDFVDTDAINPDYDQLHDYLMDYDWVGQPITLEGIADTFAKEQPGSNFQVALTVGQYRHPEGVFFGGHEPSWSRTMFECLLKDHAQHAKTVCLMDIHTGLGPKGVCEPITLGTKEQVSRVRAVFGQNVTSPDAGTSTAKAVNGTTAHGFTNTLPDKNTLFLALEYGTLPFDAVMACICADTWLYNAGRVDTPEGQRIKQTVRDTFYCDDDEWKHQVWDKAKHYLGKALDAFGDTDR